MTKLQLAQLGASLLAVTTPSIVVLVATAVAWQHARDVREPFGVPRLVRRLHLASALAILVIAALASLLPPQSGWLAAGAGVMFVALCAIALVALSRIEQALERATTVSSSTRAATLTRRRVGQYLAWPWRGLPYALAMTGLAALALRLVEPGGARRLMAPIAFGLAAPVFLWLYEVWIHQIVTGPGVADDAGREARRQRLVRFVFGTELVLVAVCLVVAHALLDLNWRRDGALAAAISLSGAVIAVVGCALAVSSDLLRRRYIPAVDDLQRHSEVNGS